MLTKEYIIGVFYKSDLFVIRLIVQWTKNHKFLKSFSRVQREITVYVRICTQVRAYVRTQFLVPYDSLDAGH